MNRFLVGFGIGLLLAFSACYFFIRFYPGQYARVTIKNESGKDVREVVIEHDNGRMTASGLDADEEVEFMFKNSGENVYHVIVTFDDDHVMTSDPVYIETGYRGIEVISDSGIQTENNW